MCNTSFFDIISSEADGSGSSLDVRLARNSWLRIEIGNHAKLGARLGDELERE